MASDGGSLSEVTIRLRCFVQLQIIHYWMGKTPCSEGIIGINATSASINATIKKSGASHLTPLYISGKETYMTDIPSRSFGSNISWFCKNDTDLLNLFNRNPPLPNQASWTVFSPSNAVSTKFIPVLRMQHFEMGKWLQLKKAGKNVGKIRVLLSELWEWSLGYRMPRTSRMFYASHASQLLYARAAMVEGKKLQLAQYLGCSRLLARR